MPPAHDHDRADKPLATFRRREQVNPAVDFGFNVGLESSSGDFSVSIGTGTRPQSQLKPKIRRGQAKTASRSSAGFQLSTSSSVICSFLDLTASTASSLSMLKTFAVMPSVARASVRKL